MRSARRLSQLFFLFLFVFLFLGARFPYEPLLPSDLFLRFSPLTAIVTFLSSWSISTKVAIGFLLLLLTIPLGRFFCGWICPLGTILDFSDKKLFQRRSKKINLKVQKYVGWKFFILIFLLIAAIFSVQLAWFFDPIVLVSRFLTVVFYPAFVFLAYGFFNLAFQIDFLQDQVYTLYDWSQKLMLPVEQPPSISGLPIAVLFLAILALGLVSRRFWCRCLCPLGALLGLCSKYRLLKRKVDSTCTSCGLCLRKCRMDAISGDYLSTNKVECIECGQCVAECPSNSISYGFGFDRATANKKIDLSRRRVVLAGIAGFSTAALFKTTRAKAANRANAIRPPGAIEEESFLQKCIRCQACTRICASTGGCLQPSLTEADWEGLWTPIVVPRIGYCEYNCALCGAVCPTGAIQTLSLAEKQKLVIGRAFINKEYCIPWRDHKDCLVCEEHCPLPEKAIRFDRRQVRTVEGDIRTVKFPYVVAELCIGCGICENKCPVTGYPGIYVTSDNNKRVEFKP